MSDYQNPLLTEQQDRQLIPVLPLRDVVVYPHMVIPLFVGREKSIVALDRAMNSDKKILLIAQQKADVDDPAADDLYGVGTLATILQLLKLPDGTVKVLVEGGERALVDKLIVGDHFSAEVSVLDEEDRLLLRDVSGCNRDGPSHAFDLYQSSVHCRPVQGATAIIRG